jgi:hypothetical protein
MERQRSKNLFLVITQLQFWLELPKFVPDGLRFVS